MEFEVRDGAVDDTRPVPGRVLRDSADSPKSTDSLHDE
jgi:hypothetical protein